MDPYIIVFDAGTSSLKAVVYDRKGRVQAKKSKYYDFSTPREGWAEIDPRIWWDSLVSATRELRDEGIALADIRGIALTGQMHTAVLLGKEDEVIAPSILWLDRRAAAETEELQKKFKLKPYVLNSSYTLPKLYWQSKHQPDVIKRVKTILWPKDYLRFLLTGEKATDFTEGIGSSLINWDTKQWVPERIGVCGLTPAVLPEIKNQEDLVPIKKDIADGLGFSKDCPVLVGLGDIASLLGGAPYIKGRLVYSMGSSSMYFTEVDFDTDDGSGLYSLEIGGYKLFGGVSSTTGASLKWAHEQLWGGTSVIDFEEMIDRALKVGIQEDPVLFFPFLAGERSPFWTDKLNGSFEGLKLHHNRDHLTRGVMEGVAFSIQYILDLMAGTGVEIQELALSGGGAGTKGWPQLIADVTGKRVKIYNTEETVSTVLFAIAASVLSETSFREILAGAFSEPKEILPETSAHEMYRHTYVKYKRFLASKIQTYEL